VLLGIVIAFFIVEDISSPLLIFGAALTGVLTVTLVELLHRTKLVKEDAAIGLVFPALFSLAVILISHYAGNVHLDVDAVLLGELAFAPFDRLVIGGRDIGPTALYVMGGILLLNVIFITLFYKELKLATFDAGLAAALGFAPAFIHYGLMTVVSITAVGAFDAVGSILVVALMIAPPVTAYLLTDSLPRMIGLSALIGATGAIAGFWLAMAIDASIAGSMAGVLGTLFALAFLFAPQRGLVALAHRRSSQRWTFAQTALTIHLLNHQGAPDEIEECSFDHLEEHLRWDSDFAHHVVRQSERAGYIERRNGHLLLTENGRSHAATAITA
jgi:manganese/zinc/iron transport system permease protein